MVIRFVWRDPFFSFVGIRGFECQWGRFCSFVSALLLVIFFVPGVYCGNLMVFWI